MPLIPARCAACRSLGTAAGPGHHAGAKASGSGWTTSPGVRPGLVVLPGPGLDSVRAIVRRDLDYTDRFEMIRVADAPAAERRGGSRRRVNYGLYRTLGAQFAVEVVETTGRGDRPAARHQCGSRLSNQQSVVLPPATGADFRLEVHRLADEVARWASGSRGSAASRLLFVSGGRVYRVDSDGEDTTPLTPAGQTALSPAWSPDGQRIAFTQLGEGRGGVVVQTLSGGGTFWCPVADRAQHHAGVFARRPDPGLRPFGRARHRHLHCQRGGTLLRATLDRGTLRGQLKPNVFARRAAYRVHLDARRTAPVVRDGSGRDRPGAAGALRFRRHR